MSQTSNLTLFLLGLAIGGVVAVVGGLIDYALHLRRNREPRFGVPGCLVYTVGGLIVAGIAALIYSAVTTNSLRPALVMGAGVMTGFYAGFMILVGLWFIRESLTNRNDETVRSDSPSP